MISNQKHATFKKNHDTKKCVKLTSKLDSICINMTSINKLESCGAIA
jgi:hypothetical protein